MTQYCSFQVPAFFSPMYTAKRRFFLDTVGRCSRRCTNSNCAREFNWTTLLRLMYGWSVKIDLGNSELWLETGAPLATSAMRRIGHLLFNSLSLSCCFFHLRRVLRSETFSSRVLFYGGKYIWYTVERCGGVRGSWNNQSFILQHFRGWPKSMCAKIRHRSHRTRDWVLTGPWADVIANKLVWLHCPRVPWEHVLHICTFVTSSFGSRRGAVRTRCAKLLLVWKVERLSR